LSAQADRGPDRPVTLAAVAGAHGVTGEVRLKLFGEGVAALKRYRAFNDSALTVTKLKDDGKGGAIARFAEVTDRNAAEALRGTVLTVPRSQMPALDEGEYYHADLIGLPAVSTGGTPLGTCIELRRGRRPRNRAARRQALHGADDDAGGAGMERVGRPRD
jgi:16S rRNA processing protein RimM